MRDLYRVSISLTETQFRRLMAISGMDEEEPFDADDMIEEALYRLIDGY